MTAWYYSSLKKKTRKNLFPQPLPILLFFGVPCIYRSSTACSVCLKHTALLYLSFPAAFWQLAPMRPLCCSVDWSFSPTSVCQGFVFQADCCSMTGHQSVCGRWWVTAFAALIKLSLCWLMKSFAFLHPALSPLPLGRGPEWLWMLM